MICVCHSLGVKHGPGHLDTRLLMNGGPGLQITKLQGTLLQALEFFAHVLVSSLLINIILLAGILRDMNMASHFSPSRSLLFYPFHFLFGVN